MAASTLLCAALDLCREHPKPLAALRSAHSRGCLFDLLKNEFQQRLSRRQDNLHSRRMALRVIPRH
jgi:hypothetical protein